MTINIYIQSRLVLPFKQADTYFQFWNGPVLGCPDPAKMD